MFKVLSLTLFLCLSIQSLSFAQRGDRKRHNMVENWKKMNVPPATVLTPEQALKTIKLPEGFKLELVANEPDIINPVAMKWDGNGRLWVVQMIDYMTNVDGHHENAGNGRVTIHEDSNGDGKLDKMTVFLDKLIMPRAISLVEGGALIAEPPNLWYCQDTNNDLKCDSKIKVTNYAKQGPVEHTDNGLLPAIDNWIYSAKSNRRFQFKNGKIIESKTKFRGQWGITMDDYGRLYYTSNSVYLFADWDSYGQSIKLQYGDKSIHSIRNNVGINRGYLKPMLRPDNRLGKITAVSEPAAYRGGLYGVEFQNGMFICEPAANALCFFSYKEKVLSPTFKHELYNDSTWGQREFITSTDERFRPVAISTGPDGCIYFLDFNHGILQHKQYLTTYLRKQILERGLDKHNNTGRIYRIVRKGSKLYPKPNMQKEESKELVHHLSHPNGWWRDTAQRLIVQRGDREVVPALENLIKTSQNHLAKIHALWSLKGLAKLDDKIISQAKKDSHEKVRLTASVMHLDTSAATKKVASNQKKLNHKDKTLYKQGEALYKTTCFACHQMNGKGLANLAPPLAGSDWLKNDGNLIRVVLHGLSGPIKVNGKQYKSFPVMPGHGKQYDDQKVAAVITYIKNTWGNSGKAIKLKDVAAIRKATKGRQLPWTEKELKGLK